MGPDWQAWHLGQNEPDRGQFSEPRLVEWISGCAIMVRRPVIEQAGMLDERFFYYYEETEWCLRARQKDWRVLHVPQARLWHKGVQINYQPGPNVTYYGTRNRFLMLSKHQAPARAWVIAWLQTIRTLTSWSVRPKWRHMGEHRRAMWQGTLDFLNHRWGMRRY
jgi:GT2 family glycosyltransferase